MASVDMRTSPSTMTSTSKMDADSPGFRARDGESPCASRHVRFILRPLMPCPRLLFGRRCRLLKLLARDFFCEESQFVVVEPRTPQPLFPLHEHDFHEIVI